MAHRSNLVLLGLVVSIGCSESGPEKQARPTPSALSIQGDATTPKAGDRSATTRVSDAPETSYVEGITDIETFRRFAGRPGGMVRSGEVVKFLIDNRGYPTAEAPVFYINSNYAAGGDEPVRWVALHREWAEKTLPGFDYNLKKFSRTAYFTEDLKNRDFISGRIQTFEKDGKVFLAAWFIEMDLIHEEMIQYAMEQIRRTFKVPDNPVHFVAYSTHQTTKTIAPWLAKRGIEVHRLSDLLANVPFQSLNVGEAWGIVRYAPPDPDALSPSDIPVFTTLPLDLGVVAGTITLAFQDVASHVNIKAKQRKTPNLMLRNEAEAARLRALDGKPIHLTVTQDGYTFEPTTKAVVDGKLAALLSSRQWTMPSADLFGRLVTFDSMCATGEPITCLKMATRYGGKAAGLGFLAHKGVVGLGSKTQSKLGYRLTPLGFAVPLSFYKEFVDYNSKRDPRFAASLKRLIDSEVGTNGAKPLSSDQQRKLVGEVQSAFLDAPLPPMVHLALNKSATELAKAYATTFPGESLKTLKVRSSANVEDIPQFNGAGLHNSYSAKRAVDSDPQERCTLKAKKTKKKKKKKKKKGTVKRTLAPASLACAVKGAYASLWNLRAVRERSFRRFDHRGALMGLAISPSYKHGKSSALGKIAANSVLLTRVLNTTTVYGYQLSTQVGGNLVTNPKPGTLAELTSLTFQLASTPAATVLQFAKPKRKKPLREEPILSTKAMRQIVAVARAIEEAYCRAVPAYFVVNGKQRKCHQISNSQSKPSALDMEIKIYAKGQLLFKQVREFDGR